MANTIDIDVGDSLLVGPQGPQGEIGPRGYGIKGIDKTGSNKLVDTYTVTFDDNRTATFEVTNGKGIASIDLTSKVENVDTYTITYNDETTSTFTVTNSNVSREEFEEALELTNSEMDDGLEEGEDVNLTGVAKTDLDITVCGNTKQETTATGKNLIDFSNPKSIGSNTTYTFNNDIIDISGTGAFIMTRFLITDLYKNNAGKTLKIAFEELDVTNFDSKSNIIIQATVYHNDGTGNDYLVMLNKDSTTINRQIPDDTSNIDSVQLIVYANNSNTETTSAVKIVKPMLIFSTSEPKPYEPYSGGVPSPSPDYPQDIQVVTGDNTVVIEGKNLYDSDYRMTNGKISTVNCTCTEENGIFKMRATSADAQIWHVVATGNEYTQNAGKLYEFKDENYTVKISDDSLKHNHVTYYDENMISLGYLSFGNSTFNISKSSKEGAKYFSIRVGNGGAVPGIDYEFTIMMNKGTESLPYVPYFEPQSYPLSLREMKLASVDESNRDYIHKDGTKWYKHESIIEIILNGTENWKVDQSTANYMVYTLAKSNTFTNLCNGYSSHFIFTPQASGIVTLGNVLRAGPSDVIYVVIQLEDYPNLNTVAALKSWLAENNVTVHCVAKTPTEVEITDTTLIQQLEALNKATAKGNNFIVTTETDGVKPILKVQYKESTRAKADDLEERVETLENQIKGAGHVYGIKRKRVDNSSSEWERTDDSIGLVANATHDGTEVQNDFDNLSPWKDIISFNLDLETGKKKAYYGDPDFKFDGSNGDVYTHIPDIYYKVWQDEDYDYVQIADFAKTGFTKCDAFDIQRYKAGIVGDVLHSYSGLVPAGYNGIEYFREKTKTNLGENYCLLDWRYFVIQLLYLVEYADYNAQSKLGNGFSGMRKKATDVSLLAENNTHRFVVNVTGGNAFIVGQTINIGTTGEKYDIAESRKITAISDYDSDGVVGKSITFNGGAITTTITSAIWSGAQHCGQCDSLGMKSGCLINDAKHEVIYRGIEDLYGNITQNIDGINIRDRQAYVCYNPDDYVSDKFEAPYEPIGYIDVDTNGYIKTLGFDTNNPLIRLPIESGGSTQTYITDYSAQNPGDRVARVGGTLENGAYNGPWYYTLSGAKSSAGWNNGARVIKYK